MTTLNKKLRIVADENMPKVRALFADFGDVSLVDGRSLTNKQVIDADVLLVRSVTKVNESLLKGASVQFVGTATIGVDHIDQDYLQTKGIGFSSAPGCNANAVADYVVSSLCYLHSSKGVDWLTKKIGVIGFGNVGSTVYKRLSSAGCDVSVFDPFKQAEVEGPFVSFEEIMQSEIICLHAPLTKEGSHPTYHMINSKMLSYLKPNVSIISAGRGGVIDEVALAKRYSELDEQLNLIFDVWEGEPEISPTTLSIVDIATPHIAGYSKQGREIGTFMIYEAFLSHFGLDSSKFYKDCVSKGYISSIVSGHDSTQLDVLSKIVHSIYDVMRDDSYMRSAYKRCSQKKVPFDDLRKNYIERDELNTCYVSEKNIFTALGFSCRT
ncbi:4-phosphoerythronate dehydrogenase [Marinomonas sp. 15G1-11]|uniref:Erythronate-4-phosphate dehydrogenase n=1 Tax=Marinomonas phaeophyticola TaxID=3004091 RepID=A0ABT4JVI1_9GAMM|nr:4-phosphoerythronate dehydrogenase [Marinomonas sp. 15G1-11]MCZ2722250.1 4-phosphoerythronate dehydrogenase [Marinomonas sp. 15G1-11]